MYTEEGRIKEIFMKLWYKLLDFLKVSWWRVDRGVVLQPKNVKRIGILRNQTIYSWRKLHVFYFLHTPFQVEDLLGHIKIFTIKDSSTEGCSFPCHFRKQEVGSSPCWDSFSQRLFLINIKTGVLRWKFILSLSFHFFFVWLNKLVYLSSCSLLLFTTWIYVSMLKCWKWYTPW